MRSASDPIRAAWLSALAIGVAGVTLTAVTAVWALRPVILESIDTHWSPPDIPPAKTESPSQEQRYQIAAFDTRLWTPPPAEESNQIAEAGPPPPAPPPRLQLIGIVTPAKGTSKRYLAILFDPDTDTTHILGSGESVGGLMIGDVTPSGALLVTPSGETQLKLDTGLSGEGRG